MRLLIFLSVSNAGGPKIPRLSTADTTLAHLYFTG
jgi:hypothetical protein